MANDLDPASIDALLRGRFGRPLKAFDEVGSTNDVALEWAHSGAPEGAVVVADHQTRGRGRSGRQWSSDPGAGLLFSLVLRPDEGNVAPGLVATAVGVGCARGIEAATGLEVALKWPNDLLVGGRKIAGILLETRSAGGGAPQPVVAGVGVTVSWGPGEIPAVIAARASSLVAELVPSGRPAPRRPDLLVELLEGIEDRYLAVAGGAARDVVAEATARSAILGTRVRVRFAGGREVTGVAAALTDSGGLAVDTEAGPVTVGSGEVEQLRTAG